MRESYSAVPFCRATVTTDDLATAQVTLFHIAAFSVKLPFLHFAIPARIVRCGIPTRRSADWMKPTHEFDFPVRSPVPFCNAVSYAILQL